MIKKSVHEDDLIAGMQRNLISKDQEEAVSNLTKAVELLNSAAEILDNANLTVQSDRIMDLLLKIATVKTHVLKEHESHPLRELEDLGIEESEIKKILKGDVHAQARANLRAVNLLAGLGVKNIEEKRQQLLGPWFMETWQAVLKLSPEKPKAKEGPKHDKETARKLLEQEIAGTKGRTIDPRLNQELEALRNLKRQRQEADRVQPGQFVEMQTRAPVVGPETLPSDKDLGKGNMFALKSLLHDQMNAKASANIPVDPYTHNLTSEQMVKNLEEHGTVFPLKDKSNLKVDKHHADTLEAKDDLDESEADDSDLDRLFED